MSSIQSYRNATATVSTGLIRADRQSQEAQVFGTGKFFGKVAAWIKNPGAEGKNEGGMTFYGNKALKQEFIGALTKEYGKLLGKDVLAAMVKLIDADSSAPLSVRVVKQVITDGDKRIADRATSLKDPSFKNLEVARAHCNNLDDEVSRTVMLDTPLSQAAVATGLDGHLSRLALSTLPEAIKALGAETQARITDPKTLDDRNLRDSKLSSIKSEFLRSMVSATVISDLKVGIVAATDGGTKKTTLDRIGEETVASVLTRSLGECRAFTGKAAILDAIDTWDGASPSEKQSAKLAALRGDHTTVAGFTESHAGDWIPPTRERGAMAELLAPVSA